MNHVKKLRDGKIFHDFHITSVETLKKADKDVICHRKSMNWRKKLKKNPLSLNIEWLCTKQTTGDKLLEDEDMCTQQHHKYMICRSGIICKVTNIFSVPSAEFWQYLRNHDVNIEGSTSFRVALASA
jgi:hypothetical protein